MSFANISSATNFINWPAGVTTSVINISGSWKKQEGTLMASFVKSLLLASVIASLTACGGGGGSDFFPKQNDDNTSQDGGNTGTGNSTDTGGNTDGGDDNNGGISDEEMVQLLTLVDSKNQFTVSVCSDVLLNNDFGDAIDVLTCNNEALNNISVGNDDVLGLLCPDTTAATSSALASSVNNPDFLSQCLEESLGTLGTTLEGVLTAQGPITQELCEGADDLAACLQDVITTLPEDLEGTVTNLFGCGTFESPTENPLTCFMEAAQDPEKLQALASSNILISTLGDVPNSLCPNTSSAAAGDPLAFDGGACLEEILGGVGSLLNTDALGGGLDQICADIASPDALNCLLEAGDQLSGALALLGNGDALSPDTITDLLDQLQNNPANLQLLGGLDQLLAQLPILGDLLGDQIGGSEDPVAALLAQAEQLQGLADGLNQIPVLGDIINQALAGGSFDPATLTDTLDPSQLDALTGYLGNLEDLANGTPLAQLLEPLLGALDGCDSDPLACLTGASDQLGALTDLLQGQDQLQGLVNQLLGALTGNTDSIPGADILTDNLEQFTQASDLLNEALAALQGGGLGDADLAVLTDLLDGLISGLTSGDPTALLSGITDDNLSFLDEAGLESLLDSAPNLAEPLGGLLDALGLNTLLDALGSILDLLGLGGLLGGLLG